MPGISSLASSVFGGGGRGVALSFSVPGAKDFVVALSRFGDTISDYGPYWDGPFLDVWTPWIEEAFRTEGGSTGQAWAPLTPRYAAWKAAHGGAGKPILTFTGSLSASLARPKTTQPYGIWEASRESLRLGTSRPGALAHQMGAPSRNLPARPPIRPTPDLMTKLGKSLQVFLAKAWSDRRSEARTFTGT